VAEGAAADVACGAPVPGAMVAGVTGATWGACGASAAGTSMTDRHLGQVT